MNVNTGKSPVAKIDGFKGMYARGSNDTCPPDHLTDCANCIFPGNNQITIREPISASSVIAGRTIISYFIAQVSQGAALLTLNSDGRFYDETHNTLLGTFLTADDFVALNIFGRTYVSFKIKGKALTATSLYVYYYSALAAAYVFKPIAGTGPITAAILSDPNAGLVDAGLHVGAVCFLDEKGYLSPPGAYASLFGVTVPGTKAIHFANIPIGPTGTVARVLLITKANQNELFFIPGGTINDNVTTTFDYNGPDSALLASADYLYDQLTTVPGCAAVRFYKGRLLLIGQYATPDIMLCSGVDAPEAFDSVLGTVNFPVDYGLNTCSSAVIIRSVVYVMKPNGTYTTQDNGGDPATWPVDITDSALGAYDNAISSFASSFSAQDVFDSAFVCNRRGIMIFNGIYSDIPLTYKIDSIWQLINSGFFYQVQVSHDVWKKRLYIAVPLAPPQANGTVNVAGNVGTITSGPPVFPGMRGMNINVGGFVYKISAVNAANNSFTTTTAMGGGLVNWFINYPGQKFLAGAVSNQLILMMDYTNGLDYMNVRWSYWFSDNFGTGITKLSVENFTLSYTSPTPIYQLAFCIGGTTIYKVILPPSQMSQGISIPYVGDLGGSILQYITMPVVPKDGGVYTWTMLNLSVYGYGVMYPSILPKNRTSQIFYRTFSMQNYGNLDLQRLINVNSESIEILLQSDQNLPGGLNGFIQPNLLDVYASRMWNMRPALLENA